MQDLAIKMTQLLVSLSLLIGAAEYYQLKNKILSLLPENKKKFFWFFLLCLPLSVVLSAYDSKFTVLVLFNLILGAYLFDGTFNGGSDYMNFLIIAALTCYAFSANEMLQKICIFYIGVQAALSYAVAGVSKILKPDWRNGKNLYKIINKSHYLIPETIRKKPIRKFNFYTLLSWLVMLTEIGLVLGFFNLKIGVILIVCFLIFHLINVLTLGLNRFFFAWLASYPSLLFCFYVVQLKH